jgi:signal transduction histidine kinase
LNAELQRQTSRLSALNEIARTISGLDNLDSALRNILVQIKKLLPLDAFDVLLYDADHDEIAFPLVYDSERFWVEETRPFRKTSLAATVISTGQPVLINRTEAEIQEHANSSYLVGERSKPSASIMMAPLSVGDIIIGTVSAHSYTLNAYNHEHLALLIGAAYQIGIAVENARLYDALRSELAERRAAEEVIRKLNAELEQRVLDRTAALQQANERLQTLSRVKDEFVSNVSHELRTPLTSLKMRQYLLRAHPDQLESHLQVMERETERLHRTIEELLQLSRLDQRQIEFALAPLTVDAVIQDYIADRELTARAKGLTLALEADHELPVVLADKNLLEQTLAILLTNAMNYTPAGGHITVRTQVEEANGKTWSGFSVADNGPGISSADQRRLFERFFRGATGRASGVAGTGLGLAIAREIIDRHSGRIEVESSGVPGEGVCFSVWLPAQNSLVNEKARSA